MKSSKRALTASILMFIVGISLIPAYALAWQGEDSGIYDIDDRPKYNTHQWLAWEAVEMFPDSQVSWITENLLAFWQGVEAPYNGDAATEVGLNASHYGLVEGSALILDATGTTVTNDSLATLALAEYDKLIIELSKDDTDYKLAAFYAGAMSHYVSQAGIYKAIWNETLWGTFNTAEWIIFESAIENGLTVLNYNPPTFNYNFEDMSIYYNTFFSLIATEIAREDAYNATINLAKSIHPLAQSIHDDLNASITEADQWEATYFENVEDCLTWSVEAIYAALSKAMHEVEWRYLTIPESSFTYDNYTHHLELLEFEVTYTEDSVIYILNDSLATLAEAWYVYYDEDDEPDSLSSEKIDLEYNDVSEKWFLGEELAPNTIAYANHSILYRFDMDRAAPTWSNLSSEKFYVDYYNCSINSVDVAYSPAYRTLSIDNVTITCYDLPEIGTIQDYEVESAEWILYQKGTGSSQTGHAVGFPVTDTANQLVRGLLTFNSTNGTTWYSHNNDIGLVFTQTNSEMYVVIRVRLIIPSGFWRTTILGGTEPEFIPYLQLDSDYYFKTKDHQITISKPKVDYFEEYDPVDDITKKYISAYNITAFSDYNDTELNYYEIVEKTVYGDDRRERRWKIFLWDGIQSRLTGDLQWNDTAIPELGLTGTWYIERVEVTFLPDNQYYLSAKIVNMNVNFTTSPWGPESDLFEIKNPLPVIYYILPEFFLAGFVVFFGWLAWYRPRKKRLMIERERQEKLEKVYD
ncbi:MAG: hypothetical protein FK731_06010 [Asgard group archaeon]|nr:hypothetical protein [Asgard group archaeon]